MDKDIKNLELKAKIGWRQFYKMKGTVEKFINAVKKIENTELTPIIKKLVADMTLQLEANHKKCNICKKMVSGDFCYLSSCSHFFHTECFKAGSQEICPTCKEPADYILYL